MHEPGAQVALILLKPLPIAYLRLKPEERKLRKAEFYEDSKRLIGYYEKHGFRAIPETELMASNPKIKQQPIKHTRRSPSKQERELNVRDKGNAMLPHILPA